MDSQVLVRRSATIGEYSAVKSAKSVILNVDQDSVRRNHTARVFSTGSEEAYLLYGTGSKEECLSLAELHRPDLVLLPWELGGVAGTELCTLLREGPKPHPLIVLRIPASRRTNFQASLSDCPADAYLPERAGDPLVLATVKSLLRARNPRSEVDAQQEAARLREEIYRFSTRVSHDLAEPLRGMTTFAQMLAEKSPDMLTAGEKNYLAFVLAGVERARHLLHYMLEYTRVDADRSNQSAVTLSLVVSLAVNSLRKRIEEAGATMEIEEPLPVVAGHAQELQKVFQSLIGNAVKYRRPEAGPTISIKAVRRPPSEWLISVADTGIGIPPRYHESIFEPFERLHGKEIPGSGMGLALARRILEAQQGRIWVESEPGQGATFFFTLPTWDE